MNRPFTPETLAERWGVSAQTIRNEIARGALPAFRIGRAYRIRAETVEEIEGCPVLEIGGLTVVK